MLFWILTIVLVGSVLLIVTRAANTAPDDTFLSKNKIAVTAVTGAVLLAGGFWVSFQMARTAAPPVAVAPSTNQQTEMVRELVQNLSDRLSSEGGSAQEWARLIASLGILGDVEQAEARWGEARISFAGDPDGLAEIRAAAQRAGVAE